MKIRAGLELNFTYMHGPRYIILLFCIFRFQFSDYISYSHFQWKLKILHYFSFLDSVLLFSLDQQEQWLHKKEALMWTTSIIVVNCVVNHFPKQEIWRIISTQFMKATKITNVNLVVNHFPKQEVWRIISTQFTKATN